MIRLWVKGCHASSAKNFLCHHFCSAYKNKGVQLLLDGVTNYLPSPLDVTNTALVSPAQLNRKDSA